MVAVSSGNHAQAVALAARLHGIRATIVMPGDAPPAKLAATRGYGAEVVPYDRYSEDREASAALVARSAGSTSCRPYDDPYVMAGQGTLALELLEDAGPLDVLLVCVGGGGLIRAARPRRGALAGVRVIGVEPEAGDDTKRSLEAGRRVRIPVPRTIADGQQAETPGELTFEVNRRLVRGRRASRTRRSWRRWPSPSSASSSCWSRAARARWPPCWPAGSTRAGSASGSPCRAGT